MTFNWVEAIGICATLLIFVGFTGKDIRFVRGMNLIGSVIFVIYGILIGSISVWLLNGACAILNIVKLLKHGDEQ